MFGTATQGDSLSFPNPVESRLPSPHRTLLAARPEYVTPDNVVFAFGGSLRVAKLNMARGEIVGEPVPMLDGVLTKAAGGFLGVAEFSVSRNGTLAYTGGGTIPNGNQTLRTLVWVNRRGEEAPLNIPPRPYAYARLSPDGNKIALDIRDQDQDIWVWDIAREQMTRLTNDPGLDTAPLWTPDNKRIVFGFDQRNQSGPGGVNQHQHRVELGRRAEAETR